MRRELALVNTACKAPFEALSTLLVLITALTADDLLNMMGNSCYSLLYLLLW
jgi:hypothetical protein